MAFPLSSCRDALAEPVLPTGCWHSDIADWALGSGRGERGALLLQGQLNTLVLHGALSWEKGASVGLIFAPLTASKRMLLWGPGLSLFVLGAAFAHRQKGDIRAWLSLAARLPFSLFPSINWGGAGGGRKVLF